MDSALIFVVVLGVLIFFHELGHFLVARLFGVGVEKFSLGFGPRIVGKTIGRTDYRVSLIPLGGYVKMVGQEPDNALDQKDVPLSFTHKHVAKRALIVAAGPIFNILLAIMILSALFLLAGLPSTRPIVRSIDSNGPGWQAGIRENDVIQSIDGKRIHSWFDIDSVLSRNRGETLHIMVARDGAEHSVSVLPRRETIKDIFGDDVDIYQLGLSDSIDDGAMIKSVDPGMPAEKAGLMRGDKIIAIDGKPIERWETMHDIISSSKGRPLEVVARRNNDTLQVTLQPVQIQDKNLLGVKQTTYRIGIHRAFAPIPEEDQTTVRFGFFQAIGMGIHKSWFITTMSVRFFAMMVKGQIPLDNIGGPIRIAQMAKEQAYAGAIELFLFVASISIQLAILNLLPIPVLDGGHLFFYFIEAVQRKPISARMRETAQQIGLFLLILLMIFVFYNDISLTWFK